MISFGGKERGKRKGYQYHQPTKATTTDTAAAFGRVPTEREREREREDTTYLSPLSSPLPALQIWGRDHHIQVLSFSSSLYLSSKNKSHRVTTAHALPTFFFRVSALGKKLRQFRRRRFSTHSAFSSSVGGPAGNSHVRVRVRKYIRRKSLCCCCCC